MSAPMAPPVNPSIDLCGRISATALWLAGPRQDARVSSPRLAITKLMLNHTPPPGANPHEAPHYQNDAYPHAPPGARAQRGRPRRVVGVGGIATPGAALVAQHRRQDL